MFAPRHTAQALAAFLFGSSIVQSCAAADRYVPPEALDTPASNLSDALTAFATKTQSEVLNGYRRAAREDKIRGGIMDFVLGGQYDSKHLNESVVSPTILLCKPRYGYLRIAVPLQNTSARAIAIKSTLQAPSSDIPSLLKVLTKTYSVDPTITKLEASYDAWVVDAKQGKPCVDTVASANPFETRSYVGDEIGIVAVLAAGKAVFDTIWGIVKPAVTGVLQNVEKEKRTKAVKDYFSNPTDVAAVQADIGHIETFLGKEFVYGQRKNAGIAVASLRSLQNLESPAWTTALGVLNNAACKDNFAKLKSDKTDPEAVGCMTKVNAALDPAIKASLDASDAFDTSMDRQLPSTPLSKQIDSIAKIARGEAPPEGELMALWSTLIRYATLFNTVQDTASDTNQKKINDAIDALKKALN
jgi:hypothetical protein